MSETPGQDTGLKRWDAYQRAEAERDGRDPKAPTWGLMLLYPVAALAIWIGMFLEPGRQVSEQAQWLLTLIGGVWIAWVSIRLLIRERHRYRIWAHCALGALAVAANPEPIGSATTKTTGIANATRRAASVAGKPAVRMMLTFRCASSSIGSAKLPLLPSGKRY
jgi:hypothetical protein